MELENKIIKVLENRKMCFIATAGRGFVDNAMVAYYSEGVALYFGSYADTLKNRNLKENPRVAVCVENVQIHGIIQKLERGSAEFTEYVNRYCEKFPSYRFYFAHETNEFFRIKPLVIWHYDTTKESMHREKVVFDGEYYDRLVAQDVQP